MSIANLAAAAVLGLTLGAGGCDAVNGGGRPLDVGDELVVTAYAPSQPTSREAYAEMGVIGGYGSVWLYSLGTGPDDPPRLVRSIRIPGLITVAAQVDRHGYVWVATPDLDIGGPHDAMYVVDPYGATVHRVVTLPQTLRAVADLSIYDDGVFVRAWRNGFSGGIGRIDPACSVDETRCDATLFAELGTAVGGTFRHSIRQLGGALYSTSTGNSRGGQQSTTQRIDPVSGEIVGSVPFSGQAVTDGESIYLTTRNRTGAFELVRQDPETFEVTGATPVPDLALVAYENGIVYLSNYRDTTVRAYDAGTLSLVRTYSVPQAGGVYETFSFPAPGVLMLNGTAALDVRSGRVLLDPAHGTAELGFTPGYLHLPQGRERG